MKQFSPLLFFFFLSSSFVKAGADDVTPGGLTAVGEETEYRTRVLSEEERTAMIAARKQYMQNSHQRRTRKTSLRDVPVSELQQRSQVPHVHAIRDSVITSVRKEYSLTKHSHTGTQSFSLHLSPFLEPEIYTQRPVYTIRRGAVEHYVKGDSYTMTLQQQTDSTLVACPLASLSTEELEQKLSEELAKIEAYKAIWKENKDALNIFLHIASGLTVYGAKKSFFIKLHALEKDPKKRPNPFFTEELYKELEKRDSEKHKVH